MEDNTSRIIVPKLPPQGWPPEGAFPQRYQKDLRLIHFQADTKLSLVQRKLMTILLANSYHTDRDSQHVYHFIKTRTLCEQVGWEHSRDRQSLFESMRKLAKVQFFFERFDLSDQGIMLLNEPKVRGKAVGFSQFMSDVYFLHDERGNSVIRYMLGPSVAEYASNSRRWSEINIETIRKISSEPALALYELLYYFRTAGETNWIPLDLLHAHLGTCHNRHYADTRRLTQKILTPAVEVVTDESDIEVSYEAQRVNRKITAFKFKVAMKPLERAARQADLDGFGSTCFNADIVRHLMSHGVHQTMAEQMAIEHPEVTVMEAIAYSVRARNRAVSKGEGNRFNLPGYIVSALKGGYTIQSVADQKAALRDKEQKLANKQACRLSHANEEKKVKQASDRLEAKGVDYVKGLTKADLQELQGDFLAIGSYNTLYRQLIETHPDDWMYIEDKGLRGAFNKFVGSMVAKNELAAA
ncbi:replication initiation protein [Duganella vulcania]|uniref:RepB family plasmid replication initiator protein n=1 Tax=Duganella vulcania TaxID=2692166 RepID=A0A845GEN7_9BURK|nr:replication initiation protein [Duganella vulcania]MYM92764.1 RepB family plasmid replication initiator protein [Duganella vulcania]